MNPGNGGCRQCIQMESYVNAANQLVFLGADIAVHDDRKFFVGLVRLESSFFFFSSRRRHTRCSRDWSSDVCSSDLEAVAAGLHLDYFIEAAKRAGVVIEVKTGGDSFLQKRLGDGAWDLAEQTWVGMGIGRASCRGRG